MDSKANNMLTSFAFAVEYVCLFGICACIRLNVLIYSIIKPVYWGLTHVKLIRIAIFCN